MFGFFKDLRPAVREAVSFDDERIVRTMGRGRSETVRWNELREIVIVTTDGGPFMEDLYWILHGDEGGCAVPACALGMDALLERLQTLEGFDNEAVINAMGSTQNATFVVWRRA